MTHSFETADPGSSVPTRAVLVLSAAVRRLAEAVAAEADRRRTARLLALDDALLRDIGVTRGDVEGALLTDFGSTASDRLAGRREERRRADLARIREARGGGAL